MTSSAIEGPIWSTALTWLRRQDIAVAGGFLLAIVYTAEYLGYPSLPGNNAQYPLGWWGWFDQSQFLASVQAFVHHDLSPAHHLYPLGYALLGAAFGRYAPQHPFFFVDLVSLLTAYAAFIAFALRCGLARKWSAMLFVLAAAPDPVLFQLWIVPWNTTPLAAVIWLLLATAAAHMQGRRRPATLGLLAACVPMLRPTDTLFAGIPVLASVALDILHRRLERRDVAVFMAALLLPLAAYGALHLAIYGPRESDYMRIASALGFTFHEFGLKAYLILVDPTAWIGGGEGLIRRCPWLILGLAGLLTALRRPAPAMLAVTLAVHGVFYLTYVDLLANTFWRYMNVHYWTFTFPGFALLAVLLLRDLLEPRGRAVAVGALAGVVLLLCFHLDPVRAAPGQPAAALDLPAGPRDFNTIFFGDLSATDAEGTLVNQRQFRAFPLNDGVRILSTIRALHVPVSIAGPGGGIDGVGAVPLRVAVHFGLPFWPWTNPGEFYGPRH